MPETVPRAPGIGAVVFFILVLVVGPAAAQERPVVVDRVPFERIVSDWQDCGLRNLKADAFVTHRVPLAKRGAPTAEIQVDYGNGFTPEAQAAFERAVEIWESHISSPVPIRIEASFEALEERTLGGARSNVLFAVDTDGDEQIDTVYGDALVDAILGSDQNTMDSGEPNPPDIVASFNSTRDDWHFGAGDAPEGTIDFTTVVVHEIAHGLNYFDIFSYDEGVGEYGFDWDDNGSVDDDEKFAGVYDNRLFLETTGGAVRFLTDRNEFSTPSSELGSAFTSGQLFFEGPATERAAAESDGPVPPKIYAPSEFDEGSSIAHLDEDTYPFETPNALMTPKINQAETVRQAGPIVCGQMTDMGWTLGPACAFDQATIEVISATPQTDPSNRGRVDLTWQFTGEVEVEEFVVEQSFFGRLEQRKRIPADGSDQYSVVIEGLRVGDHSFRISYVTADGVTVQPGDPITVTVQASRPEITVFPNPFRDVASISFALPARQQVRVDVFDALGRHVATPYDAERPAHDPRPVVFHANRLPDLGSGLYFFRVTGDSFTETTSAMRIR